MLTAHGQYFGWSPLRHAPGCGRAVWEIDTLTEHDAWRPGTHSCPDLDCGHSDRYERETIRIVCRSCGVVVLFKGELNSFETTSTNRIGYGLPPRKVAGLWLYPGPLLDPMEESRWDYLCAVERVDRLEQEHVVGYIQQSRGPRGGQVWGAGALPEIRDSGPARPPYLQFTVTTGDVTLKTVAAAAKWVSGQVKEAHRPGAQRETLRERT